VWGVGNVGGKGSITVKNITLRITPFSCCSLYITLILSYIYTAVLHGHTCTHTHPLVIAPGSPGPTTAANTTAANTHPHHTISHPTVHRSTTLCQWAHSSKKEVIPNIMFLTLYTRLQPNAPADFSTIKHECGCMRPLILRNRRQYITRVTKRYGSR